MNRSVRLLWWSLSRLVHFRLFTLKIISNSVRRVLEDFFFITGWESGERAGSYMLYMLFFLFWNFPGMLPLSKISQCTSHKLGQQKASSFWKCIGTPSKTSGVILKYDEMWQSDISKRRVRIQWKQDLHSKKEQYIRICHFTTAYA